MLSAPQRPRPRPTRLKTRQLRPALPRSVPAAAALAATLRRQHELGRGIATCSRCKSSAARFHRQCTHPGRCACCWPLSSGPREGRPRSTQPQPRNASRSRLEDRLLHATSIGSLHGSATALKERASELIMSAGASLRDHARIQAVRKGAGAAFKKVCEREQAILPAGLMAAPAGATSRPLSCVVLPKRGGRGLRPQKEVREREKRSGEIEKN